MTTTLKLEVGKTYVDSSGEKSTILFEDKGRYISYVFYGQSHVYRWYTSEGLVYGFESSLSNLVKEYKEPKVHKRDVVWYRPPYAPKCVACCVVSEGFKFNSKNLELKRETVEYIEE